MSTTMKRKNTKEHHHSTTGLNMLKKVWAKECLKAAQKDRLNNEVKHSAQTQSFFNFLSYQRKSDDILLEVKLDDVNNTEMGKTYKC